MSRVAMPRVVMQTVKRAPILVERACHGLTAEIDYTSARPGKSADNDDERGQARRAGALAYAGIAAGALQHGLERESEMATYRTDGNARARARTLVGCDMAPVAAL